MGKKILLFILTSTTVLTLGACSYAFNFITSTSSSVYEEIGKRTGYEDRREDLSLSEGDPISVLLMGLDRRPGETTSRTDTLILMTINPDSNSTQMVSVPRDTYSEVKGAVNKINSSYQVGGTELTVRSVENLLDVPVDYFAKVNFNGFENIVDTLGGVKVHNELGFNTAGLGFDIKDTYFPKGELHLNGKEALIYARMRKKDPRGDFGRQIRQRQVIEALISKGTSLSTVTKFDDMVKVLEDNVKTNMTFKDMWHLQSNYKQARNNIAQHNIEGKGKNINGNYYYIPDKEKLRQISNQLNDHLELNTQ
ncbi:LCP family protein [Halobacillus mangrovi]|uniref:LCP family glycopolymer transferase n=1 Tax=Halobacillus mangrovi TaxID=402384 RepID=UPI003D977D37